jgi:glutamate/tyrosine decarboxylase-like PLP-dependent enzyme
LGLGSGALRKIDTDAGFRMLQEQLEAAIQSDLARGKLPCAVVATVGTTVTGSIDPVDTIATVARRHGLWLHVDAAYGGGALLAPKLRERLGDFSKADSIALDLHKWLYVALDAGMILFRDPKHAERVFAFDAEYVDSNPASRNSEPTFLCRGLEASRPFRALAPYWALRQYGRQKLGNNIQFNADCARYLADRVSAAPQLELINVPELSICCFRYHDEHLTSARLDAINERIRAELESEGRYYLSPTRIEGRSVLRVCLVSSATRPPELRELVQRVVELGARFATQSSSGQAG